MKRSFYEDWEDSERDGPLLGSPVNDTRSATALGAGSPGHATLRATDLENVVQTFLGRLSSWWWRVGRYRPPGRTFCRGVVSHGFFGDRDGTRATPREQKSPAGVGGVRGGQDCTRAKIATPVRLDCAEATI